MTALIRALGPVLVLLLAAACTESPPALAGGGEPRPLRIAAWNAEHLSDSGEAGYRPRDEAGYDIVARYVREIDADVWLLQEIER